MISHEKHQYFYEKYLRNEMPDSERQTFEEKLSVDGSFRRSFDHYKKYRKEFLEGLLAEESTLKKKWTLNSWLYLFISLTGIILAINYYVFKEQEPQVNYYQSVNKWNIFKRIPFLNKRNEAPKHEAPVMIKSDTDSALSEIANDSVFNSEVANEEEISGKEDMGVASDMMELDSFVVAYEKNYFELRFKTIKDQTDSILMDSLMDMLAAKSASRNAQLSKPLLVYVEFCFPAHWDPKLRIPRGQVVAAASIVSPKY